MKPIDWSWDPVHDRRAPEMHWSRVPYLDPAIGDHKIIWELNRHQHWVKLGRAYWLLEDYGTAVETLRKGVEQDPTFGINYAYLGYVYYTQRNFEQAIVELQQAVSFGYSSEEVYYHLGLSLAYLEQCDQAVGWLQRALELNPESQPAQSGMSLCTPDGSATATGG